MKFISTVSIRGRLPMDPCQRGNVNMCDGVAYLSAQKISYPFFGERKKKNRQQNDYLTLDRIDSAAVKYMPPFGEQCPFSWGDICEARTTARRATTKNPLKIHWTDECGHNPHIYKCANDSIPNLHQHLGPSSAPQPKYLHFLMSRCEYYTHCANITYDVRYAFTCFSLRFFVVVFSIGANHNDVDVRRVTCEQIFSRMHPDERLLSL